MFQSNVSVSTQRIRNETHQPNDRSATCVSLRNFAVDAFQFFVINFDDMFHIFYTSAISQDGEERYMGTCYICYRITREHDV